MSTSCNKRCPTYATYTAKCRGNSRVTEKSNTCEYGVFSVSSMPHPIAKLPFAPKRGGRYGNPGADGNCGTPPHPLLPGKVVRLKAHRAICRRHARRVFNKRSRSQRPPAYRSCSQHLRPSDRSKCRTRPESMSYCPASTQTQFAEPGSCNPNSSKASRDSPCHSAQN